MAVKVLENFNSSSNFSSSTKMEHKHNTTHGHASDTESDTNENDSTELHRESVFSEEGSCGSESDTDHCLKALAASGLLDSDLEQSQHKSQIQSEELLFDALLQQDTKKNKQKALCTDSHSASKSQQRLSQDSDISKGSLASSISTQSLTQGLGQPQPQGQGSGVHQQQQAPQLHDRENENEKQHEQDLEEAIPLLATAGDTGTGDEGVNGQNGTASKNKQQLSEGKRKTAAFGVAIAISTTVVIAVLVTIFLAFCCYSKEDQVRKHSSSDSIPIDNLRNQTQKNIKILNQQQVVIDGKPCSVEQGEPNKVQPKATGEDNDNNMSSDKNKGSNVNISETDVNVNKDGRTCTNRSNTSSSTKKMKICKVKRGGIVSGNGVQNQNQKQDNKDGPQAQHEDIKIDGKQNEKQSLLINKHKDRKQQNFGKNNFGKKVDGADDEASPDGNKNDSGFGNETNNIRGSNGEQSDSLRHQTEPPSVQGKGQEKEIEKIEKEGNDNELGKNKKKNATENGEPVLGLDLKNDNSNEEPNLTTPSEVDINNQSPVDKLPTFDITVKFGCIANGQRNKTKIKIKQQDMLQKVNKYLGLKQKMDTVILGKNSDKNVEQIIFIGSLAKCQKSNGKKNASKDMRTMVVTTKGVYNFDFDSWTRKYVPGTSYLRWAIPIDAIEFDMEFEKDPKITLITLADRYSPLKNIKQNSEYPKAEGQAYIFKAKKAECIQSFISAIKEGQKFSKGKATLETAHGNVFAAGLKKLGKGDKIDDVVKNMSKGDADILRKAKSDKKYLKGLDLETVGQGIYIVLKGICMFGCAVGKCAGGC